MRDGNLVVVGECMVTRPFTLHQEPAFTGLARLLRGADVTYGHLEMNLDTVEHAGPPGMANRKASYMLADPAIADQLRWFGIDALSLANNHSLDFGAPTLLATAEHCRAAGIAAAGTGRDLAAARAPAFVETPVGRMALLSVSSGNHAHEWASPPADGLAGRPGINPLRVRTEYRMPAAALAQLRQIRAGLGLAGLGLAAEGYSGGDEVPLTFPGGEPARDHGIARAADEYGIVTSCHPRDLAGNLRAVGMAAALADLVVVAHHCNISEGLRGEMPPAFAVEFARRCIDAGADVYVGHGWHRTLGIEIYRGRPIFYGIGNFFAQSEYLPHVPYDAYEAFGHDVDRIGALTAAARPLHAGVDAPSTTWWSSAVAALSFRDGRFAGATLRPVELGRSSVDGAAIGRETGAGRTEGRPLLAVGDEADAILGRIQRLSAHHGTTVGIADGIGTIEGGS